MRQTKQGSYLKIRGGRPLKGELSVSGAKNSALPLIFASLLAEGRHEFNNIPQLKDVELALKMLSSLGLGCERENHRLLIKNEALLGTAPCPESAKAFRAGILCLGPLLARAGSAKIPLPGGCAIGARPVDMHLSGLRELGAKLFIEEGLICGSAPAGLKAGEIRLKFPSVGATENLLMAAVLAKGTSRLKNTACEPEIADLINFLKSLGAQIEQKAERELEIKGVSRLKPAHQPYSIIPDRIEAGTWLLAGACSKGEVLARECRPEHLSALLEKLSRAGCAIESKKSEIFLKSGGKGKAISAATGVYPSFPTDLQAQLMALMTQLEGESSLEERIFESRFGYIKQLNFLGAGIQIKGSRAFVKGPVFLKGGQMKAEDLRAGAGLALAGLAAEGESALYGLSHIARGYENFFLKLKSLNADVQLCEA